MLNEIEVVHETPDVALPAELVGVDHAAALREHDEMYLDTIGGE